ncbi:MAG: M56 family metallopeptidase [Prolixibacteraceae bacterium]|nr:M56 family metallopeptidase [Prolixibacteraceae bacterium]
MLISFVIPLITFYTINNEELANYQTYSQSIAYQPETATGNVLALFDFNWYHYLLGLYVLGIICFSLHLLFSHLKAMRIIRACRILKLYNHTIYITLKDIHPFSFFNKIVLSEKTLSSPDLEMIVSHEKIHIKEKHTIDIFLIEIMFLFQWFNPFAWLIKGAVRNNLEYKTDDEITKLYHPQKYQLAMVALADKKEISPFLTALNGSQLKNRIIMMKKKSESKFKVVKQLFILPLLALLVIGLSNKEAKTENVQATEKTNSTVQNETISNVLELRKAIANRIKFPWDAADLKKEISLSLYANISNNGKITKITELIAENIEFIIIDEVVIVAYRRESDAQKPDKEYKDLLSKEAKRVLGILPPFDIPDLNGKVVKFQFKFMTELQTGK